MEIYLYNIVSESVSSTAPGLSCIYTCGQQLVSPQTQWGYNTECEKIVPLGSGISTRRWLSLCNLSHLGGYIGVKWQPMMKRSRNKNCVCKDDCCSPIDFSGTNCKRVFYPMNADHLPGEQKLWPQEERKSRTQLKWHHCS